jgi:hypothetical protein
MRMLVAIVLVSGMAWAQANTAQPASTSSSVATASTTTQSQTSDGSKAASDPSTAPAGAKLVGQSDPNLAVIPAGSKIPLTLAQAVSTKNARDGDAVYAQTAFPFVLNNRILVPAGTYIQGRISHVERAGRVKGRAELLIHFTSLIYPSGYTVILPASVENTPGAEHNGVKDKEGTIQEDKDTGKRSASWCRPRSRSRDRMGPAAARSGYATGSRNLDRNGNSARHSRGYQPIPNDARRRVEN